MKKSCSTKWIISLIVAGTLGAITAKADELSFSMKILPSTKPMLILGDTVLPGFELLRHFASQALTDGKFFLAVPLRVDSRQVWGRSQWGKVPEKTTVSSYSSSAAPITNKLDY